MTHHGPATVAEQVHKMITIMSLEKDNALQEIESKSQLHSKWLKEITEHVISKTLEMGCPPRKRIKISDSESEKENKPMTEPNISVGEALPQTYFKKVVPLEEDLPIEVKIQSMKVKDLRESLRTRGLSTSGLKKELQDRLLHSIQPIKNSDGPKDELMPEASSSSSKDAEMTVVTGGASSNGFKTKDHLIRSQEDKEKIFEDFSFREKKDESFGHSGTKLENNFSGNESNTNLLSTMSPCNSPHFSEEVALPATVQLAVPAILSPQKKQNTLGKIMKATTKLFSPKRIKEQTDFKIDSLAQSKEIGLNSAKMQSAHVDLDNTDVQSHLHRFPVSDEVDPTSNEYPPIRPECAFPISSTDNQNENAFTRKLSVCSTTSTSSSSSSAKIQAIRKLVREEQALKVKDAAPNKSKSALYQSVTIKPAGDKPRFADIKEKVREQAKVNKIAVLETSSSATQVGNVIPFSSNPSKDFSTKLIDDKKKLLSLQMREKAAAEALKKNDNVLNFKTESNPSESVLSQTKASNAASAKPLEKIEVQPASPMDTYEMSDREGSSSSSDDEDSEEEKGPSKAIPEWAQKDKLQKALEKQFGVNGQPRINPDEVFGEVYTCDLSAIFGESKRFNKPRKETGDWKNDKVTIHEQMVYKRAMGYE